MLCPHCIYVFCIHLRTNSDLCHLQHKLIGFYNRDEKCLQRGTDWVFKYGSLPFIFKRLRPLVFSSRYASLQYGSYGTWTHWHYTSCESTWIFMYPKVNVDYFSSHSCNQIWSPVENKKEFCRCQDNAVICDSPLATKCRWRSMESRGKEEVRVCWQNFPDFLERSYTKA